MIKCKACLQEKDITMFYLVKRTGKARPRCKSCTSEEAKLWTLNNKERRAAQVKRYFLENTDKIREYQKLYYAQNRSKYFERSANRRASKLNATPSWLQEHHLKEIEYIYFLRDDLNSFSDYEYHVDHIVPLQGKEVCGLHVPWNLQILTKEENLAKGNRV